MTPNPPRVITRVIPRVIPRVCHTNLQGKMNELHHNTQQLFLYFCLDPLIMTLMYEMCLFR